MEKQVTKNDVTGLRKDHDIGVKVFKELPCDQLGYQLAKHFDPGYVSSLQLEGEGQARQGASKILPPVQRFLSKETGMFSVVLGFYGQ